MTCSRCGETIPDSVLRCYHCGEPSSNPAAKRTRSFLIVLYSLLAVPFALFGACSLVVSPSMPILLLGAIAGIGITWFLIWAARSV